EEKRMWPAASSGLEEDALPGALLGSLDCDVLHAGGHGRHARGPLGVALGFGVDLVALTHVGKTVVEQHEHVGGDLFAQAVAGAEVLIDPNLHRGCTPGVRGVYV